MMTVGPKLVYAPLNQFNLYGRECLMIGLQLDGIDGKPTLSYHDELVAQEFHGDEVTLDSTALGQLVTVTLRRISDVGNMMFTVVIPPINAPGPHHVETIGIRTIQRVNPPGKLTPGGAVFGQEEAYRTCRLWGTANLVETLAAGAAS